MGSLCERDKEREMCCGLEEDLTEHNLGCLEDSDIFEEWIVQKIYSF